MHPVDLQTTALAIISRNQQCHSSAAACSFSREQNTVSTCRALTSPASPACPNPHSVLRHHSPAALLSRYLLTRFRALALFGRRSAERVVNSRRRRPKTCTGGDSCTCSKSTFAAVTLAAEFSPESLFDVYRRQSNVQSGSGIGKAKGTIIRIATEVRIDPARIQTIGPGVEKKLLRRFATLAVVM